MNNIMNKKSKFLMHKLKHNYLKHSDKSRHYLANGLNNNKKMLYKLLKTQRGILQTLQMIYQ